MFVVDTTILVHVANADSPKHPTARNLLESLRRSGAPWALTWCILYEFWRVTTHPLVLASPLPRRNVEAFLHALLRSKSLHLLAETERHRNFFEQVLAELPDASGSLAHNAQVVAIMREHGVCDIYTEDRDFHRFAGIQVHELSDGWVAFE